MSRQQLEGVADRHVPPESGALSEDHAEVRDVLPPLFPWNSAVNHAFAGIRREYSGHDLDCRGFPGTVRTYVSDHLAVAYLKRYVGERLNHVVLPFHKAAKGVFQSGVAL